MSHPALDEDGLARFLDAFSARVRRDPLVGPVFAGAIPEADRPRHLATIHASWSSVLFKTGRSEGNPFGRHQALGVLRPEHFARWLAPFEETAAGLFAPEAAAALIERAHRIGDSLEAGLFCRPGAPG